MLPTLERRQSARGREGGRGQRTGDDRGLSGIVILGY